MKKVLVVLGILVAVLAIGGSIWVVNAQTDSPQDSDAYTCPGYADGDYQGNYGMWGRGMMGRYYAEEGQVGCILGDEENPMHDAMLEYAAGVLNLSADEINTRILDGESLYQIAEAEGLSDDEIATLIQDFHTSFFESEDFDNEFFQSMYDRMQQRWSGEDSSGFGPGGCHGNGRSAGRGGMMGWFESES
jgi:hypothetical protein